MTRGSVDHESNLGYTTFDTDTNSLKPRLRPRPKHTALERDQCNDSRVPVMFDV